ncbi:MAG: LysE family transporter [Planctomycetes bacterium]|nr:LysE family transporter [Planctomycetota bacterium]
MTKLFLTGLLLGWSIAWPPGPINAEMLRRGLARGFASAWAVGLGACCADFLWALAVALAAGRLTESAPLERVLSCVSVALLAFLAFTFLRGAWRGLAARRRGEAPPEPRRLQSARGGWLLGFTLALASPWNIAFWLAVFGRGGQPTDLWSSLVTASGVVLGAAGWSLFLCAAVRAGARFATPAWQIATQALTGLVMLAFAGEGLLRLARPWFEAGPSGQ